MEVGTEGEAVFFSGETGGAGGSCGALELSWGEGGRGEGVGTVSSVLALADGCEWVGGGGVVGGCYSCSVFGGWGADRFFLVGFAELKGDNLNSGRGYAERIYRPHLRVF